MWRGDVPFRCSNTTQKHSRINFKNAEAMRKRLVFITIVMLASITQFENAAAQGVCLDYGAFLDRKASLDSTYKFVSDLYDLDRRSRKPGVRPFSILSFDERSEMLEFVNFSKLVEKQLYTSGVLFNKIDRVEIQMYFNTGGTVDYATFDLKDSELTGFQKQIIGDSLCQWLVNYKSRLSGRGPYRTFIAWSVKDAKEVRSLAAHIAGGGKNKKERFEITDLAGLKTTRPDTITSIKLEMLELTEVPEELRKFKNLKILDLTNNELIQIPRFVFKRLRKLNELNITGNRITDASLRIRRNRHLKIFNLNYNQITKLPKRLHRNRRLESLWIGHNDLSAGLNPTVLRRVKHLKDLNLYDSKLTRLPSEIGKLKSLEILDVYYNKLTELPPEIGNNLKLQKMAVSYNLLEKLPAEIGNLSNLNTIYAHDNLLSTLPESFAKLPSLEILDISNNDFHELPNAIPFLTASSLLELNISYNKFQSLPGALFKINRLNLLSINNNPASKDDELKKLLPFIEELEARNVRVHY